MVLVVGAQGANAPVRERVEPFGGLTSVCDWHFNLLFLPISNEVQSGRSSIKSMTLELAEFLPTMVLRSRAPATVKKYSGEFLHWKSLAQQKYEVAYFLVGHWPKLY